MSVPVSARLRAVAAFRASRSAVIEKIMFTMSSPEILFSVNSFEHISRTASVIDSAVFFAQDAPRILYSRFCIFYSEDYFMSLRTFITCEISELFDISARDGYFSISPANFSSRSRILLSSRIS